jgi:hypothetical protein
MPETAILARPARQPALPGFIVRKLFAANVTGERATVIEACKAELAWASADWLRIAVRRLAWDHEIEQDAAAHRLPHERAAARVLNCWGHLHPTEHELRKLICRLRIQRKASVDWRKGPDYTAAWAIRATMTEHDIRGYWRDRRRQRAAFNAAVAAYRAAREMLGTMENAA